MNTPQILNIASAPSGIRALACAAWRELNRFRDMPRSFTVTIAVNGANAKVLEVKTLMCATSDDNGNTDIVERR